MDNNLLLFSLLVEILLAIYAYSSLKLIEKVLCIENTKVISKIILTFIFSFLVLFSNTYIMHICNMLYFFLVIKYFYKQNTKITTLLSLLFTVNIMAVEIISYCIVSLFIGQSIFTHPSIIPYVTAMAITATTLICLSYMANKLFKVNDIAFGFHYTTQLNYTIMWLTMCSIFIFINSVTFEITAVTAFNQSLTALECFILCAGAYLILFHNIRINKLLSVEEKNRILEANAETNEEMINSITSSYERSYRINLTKNAVLSSNNTNGIIKNIQKYDELISTFCRIALHPDDKENFSTFLNIDNLMDLYNNGIHRPMIDYRSMDGDEYRWYRMLISIYHDSNNDDILALGCIKDIDAEVREKEALSDEARHDLMTGLLNRMTAEDMINAEIAKGSHGVLFMVDIDNFKSVNDNFGHDEGDNAIIHVARTLKSCFRKDDIVGRFGGDEFMAFIKDAPSVEVLIPNINLLFEKGCYTLNKEGKIREITISVGATMINSSITSFKQAYNQVDLALYKKKKEGKNGLAIYDKSMEKDA